LIGFEIVVGTNGASHLGNHSDAEGARLRSHGVLTSMLGKIREPNPFGAMLQQDALIESCVENLSRLIAFD
jgi:hypothetical protein